VGFDADEIERLLVENPRRMLMFNDPLSESLGYV
jgi:predicted metal-dependent phosphotriesterase family hydrolase